MADATNINSQQKHKPVKITVSDPETGEVFQQKIIENDFFLLVHGNKYIKHINRMGTTTVFSIAVEK